MKGVDAPRLIRAFAWARLGIAALLLALGPALPADLVPEANRAVLAISWLVGVGTSAAVLGLGPLRRPRVMAWLLSLLDLAVVTAVVAATGGARSIFTFLYVLTVTAACVLLSRSGGLAIAGAASVLYTALVFGHTIFPLSAFIETPQETMALEILTIFLNAGTFLIVAIVAGGLAERFHATHAELVSQRRDLRDLQAFKDLVFDSLGAGVIAVDRNHVITAVNRAAEEIAGIAAATAIGRPWPALFGPEIPLVAVDAAVDASPRGAPRYELALRRGDVAVPVRMTFSALRAGDGSRAGLIAVCEDLSSIREMEARMRQADRLATLGRMAANIAHEIRNPLASLSGAIEVLASGGVATDTRERLAQIVLKESGRLNAIIADFLAYARPAPLARRPVNVAESLDEILTLLEHRVSLGTLKIVREFTPSLTGEVDPQQFRQAVWNLAMNALDAMPQGGELRVAAWVEHGWLAVRVTDTGTGIAPPDLAHIFEPFFSTKEHGSGLGLALVHRIAHDHGGRIDVQSTPGVGSAFTFAVPARA